MTANTNAQSGNGATGNAASTQVTTPKLQRTIRVGGLLSDRLIVMKMSFSPDSRYLGIVTRNSAGTTDIVVWDMEQDRQQSRIHCKGDFDITPSDQLLWTPDGKAILFGAKRQWDPLTGEALPDNPVVGGSARLNRDGSRLLTLAGTMGGPTYVNLYDTKMWALQTIEVEGVYATAASWTADDKILINAIPNREIENKTMDGHLVHDYDTTLRLIDPSGKIPTRAVWFSRRPTGNPQSPYTYSFPGGADGRTNFATNQIFLGTSQIIDGATLEVRRYHSGAAANIDPGAFGMGFSPDGKWLYLKGASFATEGYKPLENTIVDTASGNPVLQFDGAMGHVGALAVSPDGQSLALSEANSVQVYRLR